jgi:UTP--glucose-1-phosphate uridylyltransferase
MKKVRKAVIPAAGLGTRFLPATKAIPKEMIPIVDVPMIQYIVEEAVASGIEEIILITSRNKQAIEDHFDYSFEVETTLDQKGNSELAEVSRRISRMCNIISIRQKNPLGLGHAVLCAEPAIGNEPFAVLLGDDLVDAKTPCTRQLIDIYERYDSSVVGVMEVPKDQTHKYGIVSGNPVADHTWKISTLIEKPKNEEAPSRLAIPGRYVLSADIFDCLRRTQPGRGGEIQLTDALQILAKEKGLYAYEFEGDRYDTGDRVGFIDATLSFALRRPELRDSVLALLKKHLGA